MPTDESMDGQAQRRAETAAKAEEAEKAAVEKSDTKAQRALLGAEVVQGERTRLAGDVDPDQDQDTDDDHQLDTDTKDDFDKDLDALLAEFKLTPTGDPKKDFAAVAGPLAHEVEAQYHVPWQICFGQACLESGYGKHGRKGYVLFGIKADPDYHGDEVRSATKDGEDGHDNVADFRGYSSIRDAFLSYGKFLNDQPRYKTALEHADNPYRFLCELRDAKYFEDPKYVEKIESIAKANGVDLGKGSDETVPSTEKKDEDKGILERMGDTLKSWTSTAGEFIKKWSTKAMDGVKAAISGLGASLGYDWFKAKAKETSNEVAGDWREKVETPDAPFFSFPKGVEGRVSSAFGLRENPFADHKGEVDDHPHAGIDIGVPEGTSVFATHDGVIVEPHGGSTETIRTADGVDHSMLHLSKIVHAVGDTVHAGELLALTGNVGRSTGAHLHVEEIKNGKHVDPMDSLDASYLEAAQQVASAQKQRVEEIQDGSRLA